MEGAVNGAVDGVALLGESPVLTAVLGASDVVCDGELVEDLDGDLVEAAVGESVEVPDEVSDEESDGSARASPCPESTAIPIPSVITRPATRPMPQHRLLDEEYFAR